ncbi:MAG: aminoacyl-tRNA hydrolase [Bacilli bacterium]|nr:aminoacyl-tRNA hydrolase [Bacilli bacterium]MDD4406592.1 aminoacyl-tRNA hydrolase [Bacilli bacterium]
MKLIVGLGNIGKNYENTRHNIGFKILDNFLGDIKWKKNSYGLFYKDRDIIYLKPTTFMNLSGIAIKYFIKFYKINIKDILIIHDDLDINIGSYKIKYNSSSGGHNGIKSIINVLKTEEFIRIKIGISNDKEIKTKDYVLGQFTKKEKELLNEIKNSIYDIINDFKENNSVDYLMNKYNNKIK